MYNFLHTEFVESRNIIMCNIKKGETGVSDI